VNYLLKHFSIFLNYLKIRSLIGRDDSFNFSALDVARGGTLCGTDPETSIEIERMF